MKLSKLEKGYLKKLFGNRINSKKYEIGKTIINGEIFYYCVNKKAINKFIKEIK